MAAVSTQGSGSGVGAGKAVDEKERFFIYFRHEVTALQEQMEKLGDTAIAGGERADAIDHCLAGISRLSTEVKDASSYLPAYDQRTYSEAIKALQEKLQEIRARVQPKAKFAFKTRKNNSAISLTDAAELAANSRPKVSGYGVELSSAESSIAPTPNVTSPPPERNTSEETSAEGQRLNRHLQTAQQASIRKPSFSQATSVKISDQTGVHVILPRSASHATTSGTVSNLRRCIVDMSSPTSAGGGRPFAGLTIKNVKESLLICGHVNGPAHVTAVEKSVIVVAAKQFRMHDCRNCDVYLHCTSNPIIEGCEGLRFAPFPQTYTQPSDTQTQNKFSQISDFAHPSASPENPSPNFTILSPDSPGWIPESIWTDIVPGSPGHGVEDMLREVGIKIEGRAPGAVNESWVRRKSMMGEP